MGSDGNVGRDMPRPTLRSRSCGGLRLGDAAAVGQTSLTAEQNQALDAVMAANLQSH
jgi:hypothetical protein